MAKNKEREKDRQLLSDFEDYLIDNCYEDGGWSKL